MALNISVPIAFFVFALFAGLVNPLLGLIHQRLMLRRAEMGIVFIMAMMAATVPTEGYVEHMVPKIASVFYYATPENDWVDLIHPYMKGWIAPLDGEAVQHFFEGSPAGVSIPWGAWIQPLCYWALFFLTLCFVMVCTMVILRRQWIDHERLVYPLVKLPLEMIEEGRLADAAVFPQSRHVAGIFYTVRTAESRRSAQLLQFHPRDSPRRQYPRIPRPSEPAPRPQLYDLGVRLFRQPASAPEHLGLFPANHRSTGPFQRPGHCHDRATDRVRHFRGDCRPRGHGCFDCFCAL